MRVFIAIIFGSLNQKGKFGWEQEILRLASFSRFQECHIYIYIYIYICHYKHYETTNRTTSIFTLFEYVYVVSLVFYQIKWSYSPSNATFMVFQTYETVYTQIHLARYINFVILSKLPSFNENETPFECSLRCKQ
jgi:hypothetical protein